MSRKKGDRITTSRKYWTKDYDKFAVRPENRNIRTALVNRLCQSMQRHGFMARRPIEVTKLPDGKLQIEDGQHRFAAAKKEGIELCYVIEEEWSWEEIIDGQISDEWQNGDYLEHYVSRGFKHYVTMKYFIQETCMPLTLAAGLCNGTPNNLSKKAMQPFREGRWKATDMEFAWRIANLSSAFRSAGIPWCTKGSLLSALSKACSLDGFQDEQLIERAKANAVALIEKRPADIPQAVKLVDWLYNYRSTKSKRLPIEFLLRQNDLLE